MSACTHSAQLEAAASQPRLPRILHQSWRNHTSVPAVLRGGRALWRRRASRWEHMLWSDADNRQLWAAHYPSLLPLYDGYARSVERADATRLLYMAIFGGVYADLDVIPCRSVARALNRLWQPLLLVRDPWRGTLHRKRQQHVSNFFFASVPNHPFWRFAIETTLTQRRKDQRGVMHTTGPYAVDTAWKAFRRLNRGCPARLLPPPHSAAAQHSLTVAHDEWQQMHIGVHHWSSLWQVSKLGQPPYPPDAVLEDEGLLGWLGVNRSGDCAGASLDDAASELGLGPLRRRVHSAYPCSAAKGCTARKYVHILSVQGSLDISST